MSFLENARMGSFKGAPFLMDAAETTEGQNRANYLFINTGRRTSKPLGLFPPEFVLDCFTHSTDGDEYVQKRDAFRAALKGDTNGTLVHPFLGNAICVAGIYKFVEKFAETGKCNFKIPFSVIDKDSGAPTTPEGKQATSAQIASLSLDTNRALQAASAAAFINSTPLNSDSSKSLFESMFDGAKDAFAQVGSTIAKASEYTGKALAAREQAAFYADNPLIGFAKVADAILGVDDLTTDILAKFRACQVLFDFGDNGTDYSIQDTSPVRVNPSPTTNEDAERLVNAGIVSSFMQMATMLQGYSQAGAYKYTSVDEIDTAGIVLENQYQKVRDAITASQEQQIYAFDIPSPDYSDAYDKLKDTRLAMSQYLNQQKVNAARIEYIDVESTPASVLSYRLYRDSTRATEIMELNPGMDAMSVSGRIAVYTK